MTDQEIVEAARNMPAKLKRGASVRWSVVHTFLIMQVEALPISKRPKVFEVHHAIEKARAAFLRELVNGNGINAAHDAAVKVRVVS